MSTMTLDFPDAFAGRVARDMTTDRTHEIQRYLTVSDCLGGQMATDMVCALAKRETQLAAAKEKIEELEAIEEENYEKLMAHKVCCACSLDEPGDVCAGHSPMLDRAKEEVERLRDELIAANNKLLEKGDVIIYKNDQIDGLKRRLDDWEAIGKRAEETIDAMQPVVDAADEWHDQHDDGATERLEAAVETYRKGAST